MESAILLAAGNASRLLPLTAHRPKAMLLVGGKPLLQHAVEAVAAHGVRDVTVVVGPHAERVQAFLKDGSDFGVRANYVRQPNATGTLDAVRLAFAHAPAGPVWVVPASLLLTKRTLAPLAKAKGDLLLADVAQATYTQPVPEVRGDRLVRIGSETPVVGSTRVSLGIARLGEAFRSASHQGKNLEQALADWAAAAAHPVQVLGPGGEWGAVVDPWDLLRLNERVLDALPKGKAPKVAQSSGAIHVGRDCTISPTATLTGPLTIGNGCTIGDRAVVGPYVSIRHNSVVAAHCEVRRSILNNNVVVDSRSVLRSSILDDGAQVGAGFLAVEGADGRGCILGSDCRVGEASRAKPGAVAQPETAWPAGSVLG